MVIRANPENDFVGPREQRLMHEAGSEERERAETVPVATRSTAPEPIRNAQGQIMSTVEPVE